MEFAFFRGLPLLLIISCLCIFIVLHLVVNSTYLEGVQKHILCPEGTQEHSSIRLKYKEIWKKLMGSVLHCIYATNAAAVTVAV